MKTLFSLASTLLACATASLCGASTSPAMLGFAVEAPADPGGSPAVPVRPAAADDARWSPLPLHTGDVNRLARTRSGLLFAATYTGVFRSSDGGGHWQASIQGLPTASAVTIVADEGDKLYASLFTRGIYASVDGGATWQHTGAGTNRIVTSVSVSGTRVVAGTGDGIVLRSEDRGQVWSEAPIPYPTAITAIVTKGDIVLAGTLGRGVLRSTDGGATWASTSIEGLFVRSLEKVGDGNVYAGCEAGPGFGGALYASRDDGATWQPLANPCAWAVIGVASEGGELFAAGSRGGVYASGDGGASWRDASGGMSWPSGFHHALADGDGGVLLGCVGHGVARTTDGGSTWVPLNAGLTGYRVQAIVSSTRGDLFVATASSGVHRSDDGGATWKRLHQGLPADITSLNVTALADDPGRGAVWLGTSMGRVFRSMDEGESWTDVSAGLSGTDDVKAIEIDAASGDVWIGRRSSGVWRLPAQGTSWESWSCALPTQGAYSFVRAPSGDLVLGTDFTGIYRLDDDGSCWSSMNAGLPGSPGPIESMSRNPATGSLFTISAYGIYTRASQGSVWIRTSMTLPYARSLLAGPAGAVWSGLGFFNVARSNDVLESTDDGLTWRSIRGDLPTIEPVTVLGRLGADLFAGTWNAGVFVRRSGALTSVPAGAFEGPSVSVRPNPTRGMAEIRFRAPAGERVKMQVFSAEGRRVRSLGARASGGATSSIAWDARDDHGQPVAPGVYWCRITAGSRQGTAKLLVVK